MAQRYRAATTTYYEFGITRMPPVCAEAAGHTRMRRDSMDSIETTTWVIDWVLSLPLILLTVVAHVFGLALIQDTVIHALKDMPVRRHFMYRFAAVTTVSVLLMIVLHGFEAIAWGLSYKTLGLFTSTRLAMLYSLGAMTGFGAGSLSLPSHWLMMGVLQSLAGLLLFGLTTAFMFAMIQEVWPSRTSSRMK